MSESVPVDVPITAAPTDVGTDVDAVLGEVFREHWTDLVALARLLLDRQADAEEVVQEAFTRTYAAWPRVREPLPYLRRSVVNLSRGRLRRRATVRRTAIAPAPDGDGADQALLLDEQQRFVATAVRELPERQRECVVLRYLLDCSTAETAAALEISEGTVKTHLHRALAALHDALEDPR